MKSYINRALACALLMLSVAAPSRAETTTTDALKEAQNFESNGKYVTAAGIYLAIIDDYDFLPGNNNFSFTKQQKIRLGKKAIDCLQQSIKLNSDHDGFEQEMLGAASHTMMTLEPKNPSWTYLSACSQIERRNYAEANRLLDECISQAGADPSTLRQALQAKTRLHISASSVLAQSK